MQPVAEPLVKRHGNLRVGAADGTRLRGSAHNDMFVPCEDAGDGVTRLRTATNNAGGTLGGISNGEDLFFRVAVKPVSVRYLP
jgi:chorismate synthase